MIVSNFSPILARFASATSILLAASAAATTADLPKFEDVSKDYTKVVSTADGADSMYTLYRNSKEHQVLAELPRNFSNQKIFIASSIAGGSSYTGWQWNDTYCYWRRINDTLVLMEPELQYKARGNTHIEASVNRTYSDRVLLSVPVVTNGPNGGPVIDLDALLVGNSSRFALRVDPRLTTVESVKAFPQNVELTFEGPGQDGRLVQIHYSISTIPQTNYAPREADERIGYFMTVFKDFAKDSDDGKQFVRYINRWNLRKRDASLAISPPEKPIIFYVEHTVPVKYRRYVRDGILEWNRGFEKIGIDGALEVRQQDAMTGAYMDLAPEDVRYNFIRWITSEEAFAMGPSRVNPETGEILDADIIFDDSMVRSYELDYKRLIAHMAIEDAAPDTTRWLERHPRWDPRTYVVGQSPAEEYIATLPDLSPEERARLLSQQERPRPDSLLTRVVQQNRHCAYATGKTHQMNLARLALVRADLREGGYSETELIDGLPEKFVAQIIKDVVTHEVGHTLGLRHNFKASSWKTLDQLNADVGEPQVGSVMDYTPLNIAPEGQEQGDWVTPGIGPYDYWAIEYGYTFENDKLAEIAGRSAEPGLDFATDEDTMGPDPLARRFDMGKDPMEYAKRQLMLVTKLRGELLDRAVDDGEAWYPARSFFSMLLFEHLWAVNMVSDFVGATYVSRDRKGTPNARPPLEPVEADKQREALAFVIDNSFSDEAFGLTPEILRYLATDKLVHWGNTDGYGQPEFPVHQEIMQFQRTIMLGLMNPSTLRRIYDNELMTAAGDDALTLPEVVGAVTEAVWSEVFSGECDGTYSNRNPMISSLRRNLQREFLANLVDLSQLRGSYGPPRAVQALALDWMHRLNDKINSILESHGDNLDDYTRTHLSESARRLQAALDAAATYEGS